MSGRGWRASLGLAICTLAAGVAEAGNGPQFRDLRAPGNLESTVELGCIAFDEARPAYNPVDLYKAARACIAAGRFDEAVPLFTLAGVYGRFDSLRVADPTAHQAVTVAKLSIFGNVIVADNEAFGAAARRRLDPAALPGLCADIRKVGPPGYYPRYMVQHGMSAFSGVAGDGLVAGFDRDAAWGKALDSYLHCPA